MSSTTIQRSSFTVRTGSLKLDASQLPASTELAAASTTAAVQAPPVRGHVNGHQSGYLNHDNNLNTFSLNLDRSRQANVTGMQNLGAEVRIRYQDENGKVNVARGDADMAQTMRERDRALVDLAKTTARHLDGGGITPREAAQLGAMVDSVKDLQKEVKLEVKEQLGQSKPEASAQPKPELQAQPKPQAQVEHKPQAHVQHKPQAQVEEKRSAEVQHKPQAQVEHKPEHKAEQPATHKPAEAKDAKVQRPKDNGGKVEAKPAKHGEVSDPMSKKDELKKALDLINHAGGDSDNAALRLVQTRPELLKVATPNQLGLMVACLTEGKVSDADRDAILKILGNKSGSEITAIVKSIDQNSISGGACLARAFVRDEDGYKLGNLFKDKGLVGEKSPLREHFLNDARIGEGRGERGFKNLGSIDDDSSDNHSRILSTSNLLLSAALPNEKAKMLASLMDGDTGSGDENAMKRILDSVQTKAEWDDVMKGCSEYGWSMPDIVAELDRPEFFVDKLNAIHGI